MNRRSWAFLGAFLALVVTGCTSDAERRRLVIHECKLVLRHSTTEPAWAARRTVCEAEIQAEDPDERGK